MRCSTSIATSCRDWTQATAPSPRNGDGPYVLGPKRLHATGLTVAIRIRPPATWLCAKTNSHANLAQLFRAPPYKRQAGGVRILQRALSCALSPLVPALNFVWGTMGDTCLTSRGSQVRIRQRAFFQPHEHDRRRGGVAYQCEILDQELRSRSLALPWVRSASASSSVHQRTSRPSPGPISRTARTRK